LCGVDSPPTVTARRKEKGTTRPEGYEPPKADNSIWGLQMLELIVSVCLVDNPTRCKDVSLVYLAESVTPMQCMMQSQAEIAKWTEGHPNWVAKRWSCRPAGRYAKI
jgi:hypothetical protein